MRSTIKLLVTYINYLNYRLHVPQFFVLNFKSIFLAIKINNHRFSGQSVRGISMGIGELFYNFLVRFKSMVFKINYFLFKYFCYFKVVGLLGLNSFIIISISCISIIIVHYFFWYSNDHNQ